MSLADAGAQALEYVRGHVPEPGTAPLCGNSIGVDRRFLDRSSPSSTGYLHYRSIDVSSFKELCRRWYPDGVQEAAGQGGDAPRARRRARVDRRAALLPRAHAAARRRPDAGADVSQSSSRSAPRSVVTERSRAEWPMRPMRHALPGELARARRRPRCRTSSSSALRSVASSAPSGSHAVVSSGRRWPSGDDEPEAELGQRALEPGRRRRGGGPTPPRGPRRAPRRARRAARTPSRPARCGGTRGWRRRRSSRSATGRGTTTAAARRASAAARRRAART